MRYTLVIYGYLSKGNVVTFSNLTKKVVLRYLSSSDPFDKVEIIKEEK